MTHETELSEREREIIRLVATGASNKQIAQQLVISTNTVKVHLRNIFAKIEVTSRTEATLFAIREGLVPPPSGQALAVSESIQDGSTAELPVLPAHPRRLGRISLAAAALLVLVGVLGFTLRDAIFPRATPAPVLQPTPARWQSQAALPLARSGLAAAVFDDQIYALAGESAQGITGAAERYHPSTNTWEELTPKPNPVADVSAAVVAGKIYIPGGRLPSGDPTDILDIYDCATGRWESGARLPAKLYAYALANLEGKLYLFGGWDGQHALATVYEYDPDLDDWKQKVSMPTARAYAGAASLSGRILVVGGYDGSKALNLNEIYSPGRDDGSASSKPWETRSPMPDARYGMGIATLVDTVYLVGGTVTTEQGKAPRLAIQYLPQSDSWQAFDFPDEPVGANLALLPLNSSLYAFGGKIGDQFSARLLSFKAIYTIMIPLVPDQSQ